MNTRALLVLLQIKNIQGLFLPFDNFKNPLSGSFASLYAPSDIDHCPVDVPLSCTNDTVIDNSCCFEYPGGVLLQTQFWDYYPPIGPDNLFTLHGLWPDRCDGQFDQFCDQSMEIDSAKDILKEFKEYELLEKMERVWKNFNGNDESLWIHEFNKHGTCLSTIKASCYDTESYKPNQNVVDFFKRTVQLFEGLPTHDWLVSNGIVPSTEQTYTKKQIEDTLSAHFGQPVFIKCNRYHALQEVWYFHHLQGSIVEGTYHPIPAMLNGQCPESGIKWLPKKGFAPPRPTNTEPGSPRPTGSLSGFLKPENNRGCIISNGHWYTSGTCATFHIEKAPFGGYNLRSSKGYCGVLKDNTLVCGKSIRAMQFSYDTEKGYLTFGGKSRWSADKVPGKFQQVPISPGYDGDVEFKLKLT